MLTESAVNRIWKVGGGAELLKREQAMANAFGPNLWILRPPPLPEMDDDNGQVIIFDGIGSEWPQDDAVALAAGERPLMMGA